MTVDKFSFVILGCGLCLSCGAGEASAPGEAAPGGVAVNTAYQAEDAGGAEGAAAPRTKEDLDAALDALAGGERSFGFRPGMWLAESGLREEGGDYAGAVIAAYKELSYAYGLGVLKREQVEEGLDALMVRYGDGELAVSDDGISPDPGAEDRAVVIRAAEAVLAFFNGRWKEAAEQFAPLCGDDEPDSFARWILLASLLEDGFAGDASGAGSTESRRSVLAGYQAIRARYEGFPEYWYHLAPVSGEGAERCVDLAPQGPYALRCRQFLARHFGLDSRGAEALRTRREIENLVRASLAEGRPGLLEDLFPLLALEDNPFTLYALGALNALNGVPAFGDFFSARGRESGGRLAERLRYISGGRL
jgi:hypothetical protein